MRFLSILSNSTEINSQNLVSAFVNWLNRLAGVSKQTLPYLSKCAAGSHSFLNLTTEFLEFDGRRKGCLFVS